MDKEVIENLNAKQRLNTKQLNTVLALYSFIHKIISLTSLKSMNWASIGNELPSFKFKILNEFGDYVNQLLCFLM